MENNIRYLKIYQLAKQAQQVIVETIEECRKWKQINSRFIDKLKEKGLHARIDQSYGGSKILRVIDWIDGSMEHIIDCYVDSSYWNWDSLKNSIAKANWQEKIEEINQKIACYEVEKTQIKKLIFNLKEIQSMNFSYEISKAVRSLEEALK